MKWILPPQTSVCQAHHALRLADTKYMYAVSSVRNYAEDHAILFPGWIPGLKQDDQVLLTLV